MIEWVAVEYLATAKGKPPYLFNNVWIDNKDNKSILRFAKPPPGKGVSSNVSRWTGVDATSHVLKIPLELTASGALTVDSLKALGPWKPTIMR